MSNKDNNNTYEKIIFKSNEGQVAGYPVTKGDCIEEIDKNDKFKSLNNKIVDLNNTFYKNLQLSKDLFDIGEINNPVGNNLQYVDNKTCVRTKEGCYIDICKGDVISLIDYDKYSVLLYIKTKDSEPYKVKYVSIADYECEYDGKLYLVITRKSGRYELLFIDEFYNALRIKSNIVSQSKIELEKRISQLETKQKQIMDLIKQLQ